MGCPNKSLVQQTQKWVDRLEILKVMETIYIRLQTKQRERRFVRFTSMKEATSMLRSS